MPTEETILWIDDLTGDCLTVDALQRLQEKARRLYVRNAHIFEDERDALAALGAVPVLPAAFLLRSG